MNKYAAYIYICVCVCVCEIWGAQGVMCNIVGNGPGKPSSNPGWGCLHFHVVLILFGNYSSSSYE